MAVDADGDGGNTRYEVLIAEATTAPSVGSGCTLSGGRWYSYYANAYWTVPADLDIDHFVPLAEAWDSGARNWTTTQRRSFANDLGDSRGAGRGEAALAADRRHRGEERAGLAGERLPERDDHRHPGDLTSATAAASSPTPSTTARSPSAA